MKNPARVCSLALLVVVSLLVHEVHEDFEAHEDEGYEEHEEEERGVGFDKPGEAMTFRSLSLRDDAGTIAADGLMKAKKQVTAMKSRLAADMARAEADALSGVAARSIPIARTGWTWIGPGNVGGRIRTIAIHPASASTMFAGSVGGGIWKTANGGASWGPVNDFMANLAVTSIVFNPANPQVMYAGTGEGFSNADAIRGAGIFKSTNGGATWTQLAATANSSFYYVLRLAISPDGQVVLAGTVSGMFRSTDAGVTWTQVPTGPAAFDIDFHPTDSRRAVAGDRNGGTWFTTNGGATWTEAGLTLPSTTSGSHRVEIAYAKGTPTIVYAVVDRDNGLVFRSLDGGATYVQTFSGDTTQVLENGQGWYDLALWVNPIDANDLIVGGVNLYRSRDGGQSFAQVSSPYGSLHPDQHLIVEHPQFNNSTNRVLFIGNDGGVFKVPDLATLTSMEAANYVELNNNLGVTQFYGAGGNPATGKIVGGTQDNGTLVYDPAAGSEGWDGMFGGDGGFSAADPTDANYFYGEYVYLQLHRSSNGGASSSFIYSGLADAGRRANFIAPFILDPNVPRRMLAGGQSLWRANDIKAASPVWQSIKTGTSGNYISAIAVAAGNSNVIWVGHNNGDLYRTTNGTASAPTWTKVDPTSFPNRFLTRITIDPFDANIVYASFGGFADHNIQRTLDGGATWADASGAGTTGLPLAPVRDVEVDPGDSMVIWAGTEVGVFTSRDRGQTWDATHDGPANVSVDELFVLGDELYAVTHGRGLFRHPLAAAGGGAPALSFSPTSRAFPSAYLGTATAPATVAVVNSGTAPLSPSRVTIAGTHPGDFVLVSDPCTGATLDPAESCAIQLRFQPTATGHRTATVVVTSNANGSPHSAAISGDGVTPPPAPGNVPAPWTTRDIGNVGTPGTATYNSGVFSVRGAGADVWGTADAFRFVYLTLAGDGEIRARVASVENVAAWVKAGVMIRQSVDPGSAHGFVIVSAGKGIAFQRRAVAGGTTTGTSGGTGTAPKWVRIKRRGSVVTASHSDNGTTWTDIGSDTLALNGPVLIGIAVSGHSTTRTAMAVFDSVTVAGGSAGLPTGWQSRDIGPTGAPGSGAESTGTFTVRGAGADIWSTTDAFHMAYRGLSGNASITARVASISGTEAWTKVGVMIRATTDPRAAHASMIVSKSKGLAFQRRATTGGTTTNTAGGTGTAPRWVRLERAGNVFTASISTNGTSWTVIGSETITMPASVLVGLVVSSHDPAQIATAMFDNVTITP
jgi:hypothetical protein